MKKLSRIGKLKQKVRVYKNSAGIPIIIGKDNTSYNITVTNLDGSTGTVDTSKTKVRSIELQNGTVLYIREKDYFNISNYRKVKDILTEQEDMLEDKKIKILPTDFSPNDDNTYYNAYIDDSSNQFPVRAAYGVTSLYAMKEIPVNYSISSFEFNIQNSKATGPTIEVFEGFINARTSISKGSTQGTVLGNETISIDISSNPISYKNDNIIIVKFTPVNLADLFYGGTITAELT